VLFTAAIMAVLVVLPGAVKGPDIAVRAAAAPQAVATPRRAAAAPRPAPRMTRVMLVIEENHEFGQIIGSRRAPFLNRLAAHGTLLIRYFAITHPSLPAGRPA
jgi:phosphatidylinositol-3-phosphatase